MIVPVRKHAFAALVRALEDACPSLGPKIGPGGISKPRIVFEADRSDTMGWPSLGIRCVRAPLKRYQRRKVARVGGATIWDCGHFEALVQLRLGSPTHAQRVELGEQLLGAFLGDGESAGVLVTHIPEVPSLEAGVPGATACWDLDEEGWGDEMAFADKWWQTLTLTGSIPALVKVEGPLLETLRIDFSDDVAPAETVYAQLDGSLSLTP